MLHYTKIDYRRVAYGGGLAGAIASQFGFLQLFNNSPSVEYLLVRNWNVFTATADPYFAIVTQTNLAGTAQPIVAGMPTEAPPPGIVSVGASLTAITTGWLYYPASTVSGGWPFDYPFALVPPGWYFTTQCQAANVNARLAVWWQAIKPEQLDPDRLELADFALAAQNG
jgi:hypothetical protein